MEGARGSGRVLVEIFYDVISPYAWLAFEVMCRYRSIWNVDVRLRPVLLAGIMKESGNQPPALVPRKGIWMGRDLKLLAKYFQVPLHEPKNFMDVVIIKGSLSAMRFVTAVDMEKPEFVEPVSRELWRRIWSEDEDITKPESILLAAQKAGLSSVQAQTLLEMTGTAAVKDRLKQTTEDALKYGAFGMPTIVAHIDGRQRMFFGSDRFELLAYVLGEKWLGPTPEGQKSLL